MGRSDGCTGIAVKILIEQQIILEMWIVLHLLIISENSTPAPLIAQEYHRQSAGKLTCSIIDRDEFPGTGRAFNLEFIPVVVVKFLKRLYDKKIHRKPNRSTPV